MRTNTTLVMNPKGGSGKTTVATNLASYFASNNLATTLMDYDPQGSSLNWLRLRPPHAPRIHGANGAPPKAGRLRSIDMHVPPETRQLIIDAPAGASGLLLQELLSRAHCILIPVAPSVIDIHATANFIRDLLIAGKIRANNIRLAVVASRVRRSMPVYQPLERFLNSLNLPLLARLGDSDVYVGAAESGIGIFEMDFAASCAERQQFLPIAEWVDSLQLIVASVQTPLPSRPAPILAPARPGLRVIGNGTSSFPGIRR
ncbi:MAG TPA: ParA family protein [Burkholderiales bacterium]|nr:ParA family protein [Burkholderiales bacterium]